MGDEGGVVPTGVVGPSPRPLWVLLACWSACVLPQCLAWSPRTPSETLSRGGRFMSYRADILLSRNWNPLRSLKSRKKIWSMPEAGAKAKIPVFCYIGILTLKQEGEDSVQEPPKGYSRGREEENVDVSNAAEEPYLQPLKPTNSTQFQQELKEEGQTPTFMPECQAAQTQKSQHGAKVCPSFLPTKACNRTVAHKEGEARQLKTNPFPTQSYPTERPFLRIMTLYRDEATTLHWKPFLYVGSKREDLQSMLEIFLGRKIEQQKIRFVVEPLLLARSLNWSSQAVCWCLVARVHHSQRTSATYARSSAGPRIHYLDAPKTQPTSARLQRQQAGRGRLKPAVRQNRVTTALGAICNPNSTVLMILWIIHGRRKSYAMNELFTI
ncbi:hypothetical protein THAOC_09101, partial [Thalassiosira oceanica]